MSKKYESNCRLRDKWLHNDEVDDYITFLQLCLKSTIGLRFKELLYKICRYKQYEMEAFYGFNDGR